MGSGEIQRSRLTERTERLWRAIPSVWVADGRVTNMAFRPTPRDAGLLSICRSSAISAEGAYKARSEQIKKRCRTMGKPHKPPAGIVMVTVGEVDDTPVAGIHPLSAWDDSATEGVSPFHGHIDYTPILDDVDAIDAASDYLATRARERKWEYLAPDSSIKS